MSPSPSRSAPSAPEPAAIAAAWFAHFALASLAAMPREETLPPRPMEVLAAFVTIALGTNRTVLILVADDEPLPELSNAFDLALRPLCLVLPGPEFAARIALRATLSLLRSRLARDGDDEQSPAWLRQKQRISEQDPLWRDAQQWVARNDRSAWPERVADLFPVRVLSIEAYRGLRQRNADITVLFRCDAPAELVAAPGSLLRVGTRAGAPRARALVAADVDAQLRMELAQLTRDVADLELELATAQAEVAEFTKRYYATVGRRMVELDALQAHLARAQAERRPNDPKLHAQADDATRHAERSARDAKRFAQASADEPDEFRPAPDLKRLFRRVAQKIHPDRACDEADRTWRTQLMAEANRAYRAGDAAALGEVEALWREGRRDDDETAATSAAAVPATTLLRQVEAMRARLAAIERELHVLFGSRLYELFIAARHAARQGRDLLAEITEQLDETLANLRGQPAPGQP